MKTLIALAAGLTMTVLPPPVVEAEDPRVPDPYTAVDFCGTTGLGGMFPNMYDQYCGPNTEYIQSGLGAQIETGAFRFNITEGQFRENSYIGRYSYQFFEGSDLVTARLYLRVLCVAEDGPVTFNSGGTFVIPPIGSTEGSGEFEMTVTGTCPLGQRREILTIAALSDSTDPWWNSDQLSSEADGFVDGQVTVSSGGPGYIRMRVLDYGPWRDNTYNWHVRYQMDPVTTARLVAGNDSCADIMRERFPDGQGGQASALFIGPGSLSSGSLCTAGVGFSVDQGPDSPIGVRNVIAPAGTNNFTWNTIEQSQIAPDAIGLVLRAGFDTLGQVGWISPDRPGYEVYSSRLVLSSTLTYYDRVDDIEWIGGPVPDTLSRVPGLCVGDLAECLARCFDGDWSINPLNQFGQVVELIQCWFTMETDLGEYIDAFQTDIGTSSPMRTASFFFDRFRDWGSAPAYYARECGLLWAADFDATRLGAESLSVSTCSLEPDFRANIKRISTLIIGMSIAFAVIRIGFWVIGLNAVILRQEEEDKEPK